HGRCVDVHIATVLSPLHDQGPAAFAFQHGVVDGRVDAAHDSVRPRADAHLPADHERDAAEHSFFFDAWKAFQACLHTDHQSVVAWHAVIVSDYLGKGELSK